MAGDRFCPFGQGKFSKIIILKQLADEQTKQRIKSNKTMEGNLFLYLFLYP